MTKDSGNQTEMIRRLVSEILDDVESQMLREMRMLRPQMKVIAEKAAAALKEALKGHVPDGRLELLDKLPNDFMYFVDGAVRKVIKLLYFDIEEKIDMMTHNFLEIPEVLKSPLPEEVKKTLAEWWMWYNERFALPSGAFLHDGGLRVCVAYNTARLSIICGEWCLEKGKTSCKECENYIEADHVATHAIKHLQMLLEDYTIRYDRADFTLRHTKYVCIDIATGY
jgi:hypothetical protein